MPNKKTFIITAGLIIAVVLAGYALSRRFGRTSETGAPQTQEGQQAASEGLAPPPEPKQIFSYQGEVKAIGDNQITVLAAPAFNSVARDTVLSITITAATKIERLKIVPGSATLPKSGRPAPPKFKYSALTLADIKAGDTVIVSAGADIKGQTECTASRIEVIEAK